jgi:hypothetical protein
LGVEKQVIIPYNSLAAQTIEQIGPGPYSPPKQVIFGLPITTYSPDIPTEGSHFILSVTMRNNRKSTIKAPDTLISVSTSPEKDGKGEIPKILCNIHPWSALADINPSETKTIKYECIATWNFVDISLFEEMIKKAPQVVTVNVKDVPQWLTDLKAGLLTYKGSDTILWLIKNQKSCDNSKCKLYPYFATTLFSSRKENNCLSLSIKGKN